MNTEQVKKDMLKSIACYHPNEVVIRLKNAPYHILDAYVHPVERLDFERLYVKSLNTENHV